MSSLATSYAMYFNRNYEHFGPVFANRFHSILIENDPYFLKLSQYIYLNPVKAGMVANPIDYPFSSIKEVLGREPLTILDEDIVRLIGETVGSQKAYEEFIFDEMKHGRKERGERFLAAYGTIANGIQRNEPILSLKQLKKDLELADSAGIKEVIIYRLGGLNRSYANLLKQFKQSKK